MRSLLLIMLAASALAAQDGTLVPTVNDATRIAADIIHARAHEAESAGQPLLATQLEALAKGLGEGRVTLADAALVMQISATATAMAKPGAAPLSPEGRASVRHATALLDGDGPAAPVAAADPKPGEPAAAPSGPTPTPTTIAPPTSPAKAMITKVYAVDVGSSGKANVAAIGAGTKNGIVVNQRFTIKRSGRVICTCKVVRVSETLCYGEVVKDSLVDPNDDVKEGDQAVLVQ